ncbi:hypothetical protein, partial [Herbiconiux daphne]
RTIDPLFADQTVIEDRPTPLRELEAGTQLTVINIANVVIKAGTDFEGNWVDEHNGFLILAVPTDEEGKATGDLVKIFPSKKVERALKTILNPKNKRAAIASINKGELIFQVVADSFENAEGEKQDFNRLEFV